MELQVLYKCPICGKEGHSKSMFDTCFEKGFPDDIMKNWQNKYGCRTVNFADCEETPMSTNQIEYLISVGAENGNGQFDVNGDLLNMHYHNLAYLGGAGKKYTDEWLPVLYYSHSELCGHDRIYHFTYSDTPNSNCVVRSIYGEIYHLPAIHGNDAMQKVLDMNEKYMVIEGKLYLGGNKYIKTE
jgi:hypothetical protein